MNQTDENMLIYKRHFPNYRVDGIDVYDMTEDKLFERYVPDKESFVEFVKINFGESNAVRAVVNDGYENTFIHFSGIIKIFKILEHLDEFSSIQNYTT